MIVAKQGEYGAALVTQGQLLRAARLSAGDRSSIRPGPATRSRAASSATSPPTPSDELSETLLRSAMAHATVLASFNVEEFGTERIERLTGAEIAARMEQLHAMTQFSGARCELRG